MLVINQKNLNPEQEQAITYLDTPLLIIAGAGSGKTMVITHKIAHIIAQKIATPDQILAITFTNKAAKEMKERVATLVQGVPEQPFISTFHAFCAFILRREFEQLGYHNNFIIYDANDQKQIFNTVFKRLNINNELISVAKVQNIISLLKNDLVGAQEYSQTQSKYFYEPEVADIYKAYQEYLKENNAIDFDDMLFFTHKLFLLRPDILQKYQARFKYILIDEFQDTNLAQYSIVQLLAQHCNHVCAVGDFDQNIYSWRGANIKNILNFEKDYPKAKVILLEQNYRSTKHILDAANGLIKHNLNRKEKNLWTENTKGDPLFFYLAYNEKDEAEFVAGEIKRIAAQVNSDLNNIAVLYRTNAQSRMFEEVFTRNQITYKLVGGVGFYSRKEIKDIIAYLRLVFNPHDNTAFIRVINQPARGIGNVSCEKLLNLAQEQKKSIFELTQAQTLPIYKEQNNTIKTFFNLIMDLQTRYIHGTENRLSNLIKAIIEESGYKTSLEKENTLTSLERLENVLEFISVTNEETIELGDFLTQVSLISDLDQAKELTNAVTLMTLHNAKGLEFDIVFLVGMEEGLLPHYRTQFDNEAIEEERRLCYVGITRGKKMVYITAAHQRSIFGEMWYNDLSRFIKELPKNTLKCFVSEQIALIDEMSLNKLKDADFKFEIRKFTQSNSLLHPTQKPYKHHALSSSSLQIGDHVEHRVWGKGKIVEIEGQDENAFVYISFNNEVKKLMLKYAPVTKV